MLASTSQFPFVIFSLVIFFKVFSLKASLRHVLAILFKNVMLSLQKRIHFSRTLK